MWQRKPFNQICNNTQKLIKDNTGSIDLRIKSPSLYSTTLDFTSNLKKSGDIWEYAFQLTPSVHLNEQVTVKTGINSQKQALLNLIVTPTPKKNVQFGLLGQTKPNSLDFWGTFNNNFLTLSTATNINTRSLIFSGTSGYQNFTIGTRSILSTLKNNKLKSIFEIGADYKFSPFLQIGGFARNNFKDFNFNIFSKIGTKMSFAANIVKQKNKKNINFTLATETAISEKVDLRSRFKNLKEIALGIKFRPTKQVSVTTEGKTDLRSLQSLENYKYGVMVDCNLHMN
ncbi:hypothetical protein M0812_00771 [Anaeramoeba flamelloides]|uniref:Outer membrane protein beta-barrel domain-containing protein n=1 Tax=Anaeramoeba flamelloides TaxID=1746091 RepID=A0AAV8A6A2_9EUKA|nr:hypothetical protein M0812_00771 [Anaeramoeba flamelloides]